MVISSLSVINYKNRAQADLAFSPKINCFIGSNGEGKTNLLDAVYYLSFCRSSNTPLDAQVVRHEQDSMAIQGVYMDDDGNEEVISAGVFPGKRKRFCRNRKPYQRLAEHNLLEDMAYLDKSYIETLLDIRDNRNIKQSIERFMINWSGFKKKYYNINEEDPQWKTDFDTLQDILISSHYYIISGEDKSAGYSIFHDIKYVLSDLRKRNNIDWFFDNLNSIYKLSYRLGELSKVYIESNIDLSLEEKEKLIMVYYLLNSAIETTIEEFDKSNIFLLQLNQARLEAIKHNINAINNLKQSIGNDIASNIYKNIASLCNNMLNIYFNTIQIMKG